MVLLVGEFGDAAVGLGDVGGGVSLPVEGANDVCDLVATGECAEVLFGLVDQPGEELFGVERGGEGAGDVGLVVWREEQECALGDFRVTLSELAKRATPHRGHLHEKLHAAILRELHGDDDDAGFPVKPQRIIADLRRALAPEDIVICDVGAHKMWMARMFPCEKPNTCIISNGFASMGIAVPGAVAAKLNFPNRKVVAVTGDAGFLMNSQEIETAMRVHTPFVILIWNDASYGLIEWKQQNNFGRLSNVKFNNPDFVKYAEAFGATGYRITRAEDLLPTLTQALQQNTVTIIDCPVDYSENLKLTAKLGEMVCPI